MSDAGVSFRDLDGRGLRIGVVTARFNEAVTERLRAWCLTGLERVGVDTVIEASVPGAFELPLVAKAMATSSAVDAVVCLGAVIRGDTPHFDYVAGEAASGALRVSLDTGVPVMFGVLTTDSLEQAEERSRDDETNKGFEAALGAVDMVTTLRRLKGH